MVAQYVLNKPYVDITRFCLDCFAANLRLAVSRKMTACVIHLVTAKPSEEVAVVFQICSLKCRKYAQGDFCQGALPKYRQAFLTGGFTEQGSGRGHRSQLPAKRVDFWKKSAAIRATFRRGNWTRQVWKSWEEKEARAGMKIELIVFRKPRVVRGMRAKPPLLFAADIQVWSLRLTASRRLAMGPRWL